MQHLHDGASALGAVTPGSDEAPAGDTAQGFQDNQHHDSAGTDDERKAAATLQARLALRGVVLQRLPGGVYLAHSRSAFTTLADLQAVEQFARRVGAS